MTTIKYKNKNKKQNLPCNHSSQLAYREKKKKHQVYKTTQQPTVMKKKNKCTRLHVNMSTSQQYYITNLQYYISKQPWINCKVKEKDKNNTHNNTKIQVIKYGRVVYVSRKKVWICGLWTTTGKH